MTMFIFVFIREISSKRKKIRTQNQTNI